MLLGSTELVMGSYQAARQRQCRTPGSHVVLVAARLGIGAMWPVAIPEKVIHLSVLLARLLVIVHL